MEFLRTVRALDHRTLNLTTQDASLKLRSTDQLIRTDMQSVNAYRHPLVLRDGAHAFHKAEL